MIEKRKRDVHRLYSLEIDNSKGHVSTTFVKKPLDIGDAYIDNAMHAKPVWWCVYTGSDKRGKHVPHKT